MPELTINNFKGVFERSSEFNLPEVIAETCIDLLPTYEGKLVKRNGYTTVLGTTGLTGNIINFYELVTGRPSPNDVKYLCQTDNSNGQIYLWDGTSSWTQIDNSLTDFRDAGGTVRKCVFLSEDGRVRIISGNTLANLSLWWGYCDDRFVNATSANDGTLTALSGAFLSTAALATITAPVLATYMSVNAISRPSGATWWTCLSETSGTTGFYHYKLSFQYDNKQWSPLSEFSMINFSGSERRVNMSVVLPSASVSRRITGVRVYRGRADSTIKSRGEPFLYYLLFQTYVNDAWGTFSAPTYPMLWPYNGSAYNMTFTAATKTFTTTDDLTAVVDEDFNNDEYNFCVLIAQDSVTSVVYTCYITDTQRGGATSHTFVVESSTGLTDGRTYACKVVQGWRKYGTDYIFTYVDAIKEDYVTAAPSMNDLLGITSEQVNDVRAKYGASVNGRVFYANVFHNGERKDHIATYGMKTEVGLYANDVHLILNAFSVGVPIQGISAMGDRLVIYGKTDLLRGIMPTDNESTWDFERNNNRFGLLAPDSLVNIGGVDFFVSSDLDVKAFDGIRDISVGSGIYDVLRDNESYLENAIGFFLRRLQLYVLRIQTGASSYQYWAYDIVSKGGWIQLNWADVFSGGWSISSGVTYTWDDDYFYQVDSGSDDNGTDIEPSYLSAPISLNKTLIHHLSQLIVTYASNTSLTMTVYLQNGTTKTVTLSSNTTADSLAKNLGLGSHARWFKFGLAIASGYAATNTQLELHEITAPVTFSGGDV